MWWRGGGRGALLAWALVLAVVLAGCAATPDRLARPVGDRPNIVYLLADDLDVGSVWAMPNLRRLLIDQGTSFSNFFATPWPPTPQPSTTASSPSPLPTHRIS